MNSMKCRRCNKSYIAEEFDKHSCHPDIIEIQELGVDSIFKGNYQENGDDVWITHGLNGILYRLVHCKHNPPHPSTRRFLTERKTDGDYTEPDKRNCYLFGGFF